LIEIFFDTDFILSLDSIIFFVSFLPVISFAIFIPPYSSEGGLMNGKKILEKEKALSWKLQY